MGDCGRQLKSTKLTKGIKSGNSLACEKIRQFFGSPARRERSVNKHVAGPEHRVAKHRGSEGGECTDRRDDRNWEILTSVKQQGKQGIGFRTVANVHFSQQCGCVGAIGRDTGCRDKRRVRSNEQVERAGIGGVSIGGGIRGKGLA